MLLYQVELGHNVSHIQRTCQQREKTKPMSTHREGPSSKSAKTQTVQKVNPRERSRSTSSQHVTSPPVTRHSRRTVVSAFFNPNVSESQRWDVWWLGGPHSCHRDLLSSLFLTKSRLSVALLRQAEHLLFCLAVPVFHYRNRALHTKINWWGKHILSPWQMWCACVCVRGREREGGGWKEGWEYTKKERGRKLKRQKKTGRFMFAPKTSGLT